MNLDQKASNLDILTRTLTIARMQYETWGALCATNGSRSFDLVRTAAKRIESLKAQIRENLPF